MAILNDLRDRLSEDPPRLPSWIFVPITSVPAILGVINYWVDTAKIIKTEKALELHEIPDPSVPTPQAMGMPGPMFPEPGNMAAYSEKLIPEVVSAGLEGMTGQQLVNSGLLPDYISPSQARQYFERHKPQIVEIMVERFKTTFPSPDTDVEIKWHHSIRKFTKMLIVLFA
jgi:hypothetical protein